MKYVCLLSLILFLSGCGNGESPDLSGGGDDKFSASVSLQDIFDQDASVYSFGETIRVYLSITSNSSSDETLVFSSSQFYDIYITDDSDSEVWRLSDVMAYVPALQELDIASGATETRQEDLDRTLFTGGGLPAGSYRLFGYWIDYGDEVSVAFTIQ